MIPGARVSFDAHSQSIVVGSALSLDLSGANLIDTLLPGQRKLTHVGHTDVLERELADHRRLRSPEAHASDATIVRTVSENLQRLIRALATSNTPDAQKYLAMLVGYGCGLTPSGDDALLGSFAFLTLYDASLAASMAPILRERLHKTTDVSASYLSLALDGHVATQVRDVVLGFSGLKRASAVSELLATGHSSGEDIVRGIVVTAQNFDAQRQHSQGDAGTA